MIEPRTLTKAELAELLFDRVGLNKREAKDLVEGAPKDLKVDVKKDEADKIKAQIEAAGGKVEVI